MNTLTWKVTKNFLTAYSISYTLSLNCINSKKILKRSDTEAHLLKNKKKNLINKSIEQLKIVLCDVI